MPESDAERRAREKRSQQMRDSATKDPRGAGSSGGGSTWQRAGSHMKKTDDSGSSPSAPVDTSGAKPQTTRREFGAGYGDQ